VLGCRLTGPLRLLVAAFALGACGSPADGTPSALERICEPGAADACYGGPEGTEDVGACRAGARTCLPHGRGWGPCQGEILPAPEDCAADSNCDGISTCGDTLWSARLGGDGEEAAVDIAAGDDGSLLLTGTYRTAVDLGGGALPLDNDTRDVFVLKLGPDGRHAWSRAIHGPEHFTARAVAVAPDGRVALTASLRGAIEIPAAGSLAAAGSNDVGVVLLTPDGMPSFFTVAGDGDNQQPMDQAFDARGDLVVTGIFRGELDFGAGTLTAFDAQYDVFAVKLSPSGEALWTTSLAGSGDDISRALAIDRADGSIYVAGEARYDLTAGALGTVAGGDQDAFLIKLAADGEPLWIRRWGDDRAQQPFGLAVDRQGNVVLVGTFEGQMDFGSTTIASPGGRGIFVVKIAPQGDVLWARAVGGGGNQVAYGVAIDGRDRIVLSGYYEGPAAIEGAVLPESGIGEPGILVTKLEADGAHLWSRGVLVQGEQSVGGAARGWRGVAVDADDGILLGGYAVGDLDLGLGMLEPLGSSDVIVARLAP
jgi:outer membrane protein assembly factor BamB